MTVLETPVLQADAFEDASARVDLFLQGEARLELRRLARELPAWTLTPRQLCDFELLANGAFAPLDGFLGRADYDAVLHSMRLEDGSLWPIPITLDVPLAFAQNLLPGDRITLRHAEGTALGVLELSDIFTPDPDKEAETVFGTLDPTHPGVAALHRGHPVRLGGKIKALSQAPNRSFEKARLSPKAIRDEIRRRGWQRVVAFQTRNPLHRAHVELIRRAAERANAQVLLHPVVGVTKPGDVDAFTRVSCYEAVLDQFPPGEIVLSLLPLAMRMAGPREALWHALIRKNFGATHFIVGRDHAGPGRDAAGRPFYGPYEAQELVRRYEAEIGLELVDFEELAYDPESGNYVTSNEVDTPLERLSGTELRRRLESGEDVPPWFSYPEVMAQLRRRHRPRSAQGLTVFLTGLSGAGKSTIAHRVLEKLMRREKRSVTLLDGDLVRQHLSSELGFSRQHRDLNVTRIGFVAAEITKAGGIAICAPIAPYAEARAEVRRAVSEHGGFFEVHVSTPLYVCEGRDPKGLYARARSGEIRGFTGIDDPYEAPLEPELRVDAARLSPEESADAILSLLEWNGFLD